MSELETKKEELEIMKSSNFSEKNIEIMRKAILGDADAKAELQTVQDALDAKQKEITDLEG
jgi:hypothetical protein